MSKKNKKAVTPIREEITNFSYEDEMKQSFMDYSMTVITDRALPDVRDGFKPVHRRILYAMRAMNVMPDKPHKKSARIVGDVLGKYHPHGDSAVYEAMVRLSQDFRVRVPLVDGHGNFGSIDGDKAAAMRYTEARLTEEALYMLRDLEKGVVDMKENFDGSEQEPVVLPALIPQLFINGTSGIAVGMNTNIPSHNSSEIIDATLHLIKKPKATLDDLLTFVKAPDYPSGGIIINADDMREMYRTGQGKVMIRSKISVEPGQYGKTNLIVEEIPYSYSGNKEKLVNDIIDMVVNTKKLPEISDIRDESDHKIRIVIEVKKGVDTNKFLHKLYRLTGLQDQENYRFIALVDGKPEYIGLLDYLHHFLAFQKEVYTKRYQYLLPKAEARKELLEGFINAVPLMDAIIEVVRGAKDVKHMKACLVSGDVTGIDFTLKKHEKTASKFQFTPTQAQAILDMKLQKLGKLEVLQIQKEYDALVKEIEFYQAVLSDEKKLMKEIQKTLQEYKKKFPQERKTLVTNKETKVYKEEVKVVDVTVQVDKFGYVKALEGQADESDETIRQTMTVKSDDRLVALTTDGMAVQLKVADIPKGKAKDRGKPLQVLTNMEKTEASLYLTPMTELLESTLLIVTKNGFVKRIEGKEFETNRSSILAHKLEDNDKLVFVGKETDEIVMVSKEEKVLRFKTSDIPLAKRSAKGVVGMKLKEHDEIILCHAVTNDDQRIEYMGNNILLSDIECSKRARSGKKL